MRSPIPVMISGLMLISNIAHADELRERANEIFKPIPAKVAELRGKAVSPDQDQLGHKR